MHTFVGYHDVFGEAATHRSLVSHLAQFRCRDLLFVLSKANILLHNGRTPARVIQEYLKRQMFTDPTLRRLHHVEREHSSPMFFSELQLINLMKLAILHCPQDSGKAVATKEDAEQVGLCCLLLNSLLPDPKPALNTLSRNQQRDVLLKELIKNQAFHSDEKFPNSLVRYRDLFVRIPFDLRQRSRSIDIPRVFCNATGVDLETYLSLGFALLAPFLTLTCDSVDNGTLWTINPNTYFSSALPGKGAIQRALATFVRDIPTLKYELTAEMASLQSDESFFYSNLTFQRSPLIQLAADAVMPASLRLLRWKITENIYWLLMDNMSLALKQQFTEFFGHVFHEYSKRLLRRCFHDSFFEGCYGKSQQEASDGIVIYPNDLVVTEMKSARLLLGTVRSGEISVYKHNLRDVLVRASRQLDRVIRDFRMGRFALTGFQQSPSNRFYPLVVTLQGFPQNPLLWEHFGEILKTEGLLQGRDVAKLTIIDAEELELLEGLLADNDLLSILRDKIARPDFCDWPMRTYLSNRYPDGIPRNQHNESQYRAWGDECSRLLLGQELP